MGDGRSQKGKSMLLSAIQIGLLAYRTGRADLFQAGRFGVPGGDGARL
jgi:hypothetical protein